MKKINGEYYRRFKAQTGRVYWVRMSREEVMGEDLYRMLMVLMPLAMVWIMAWAAGMI